MPRGQTPTLRIQSHGLTHAGCVRELNEDNLLTDDRRGLWAVADGMGGYDHGDFASAAVIDNLRHVRMSSWPTPKSLALDVLGRLEDANHDLLREARRRGGGVIGSTVACLAVFGDHALAIWCGDSRIYRLRRGRAMIRITRDHTLVQELVEGGHLAEADAETHPEAHVLTRGLGVAEQFEPEFRQMTLQSGDRFILCSDGLTRTMAEERIEAIAVRASNPALTSTALLEAALQAGAPDNVTITTVDFA